MKNQLIVDGFNLAFRSHFAFRELMTSSGLFSGCIYGFLNILRSLKNKYPTCDFVIVWDNEARRKKALFSEYKANREHFQIDAHIQDLKDALRCINVTQVDVIGEEADDVIATLCCNYKEGQTFVYSSDKDLLQLVKDGRVIIIRPKVGSTPERIYDEEAVKKEFGVSPEDLSCFLAFRGDTCDNIPGVSRVPSKVLASLITKYHNPVAVFENLSAEELTDFQRKSIQNAQNQVLVNFSLTELRRDLNCAFVFGKADIENFQKIINKYEIRAIVPNTYVPIFDKDLTFLLRTGHPTVETESLFD